MRELLGLLFLICFGAVTILLATQKQVSGAIVSVLLGFALLGGFAIARFDWIKSLEWGKDGVKVAMFQRQVSQIKDKAVADLSSEVEAQKQSLRLVITDANTTRDKLDEQKRSLEEVYTRTKTLEGRLDEQKNAVEEAIQRSGEVEKVLWSANKVISRLDSETKVADEKLKLLEQKTKSISLLPDGRLKVGGMITGDPTELTEIGQRLAKAYEAKDYVGAIALARSTIKMIEDSEKEAAGAGISLSSLNGVWLGNAYVMGSESARMSGDFPLAIEWARKAFARNDSPLTRASLIICLSAGGEQGEAKKLVEETLKKDEETVKEFRKVMLGVGIQIQ